MFSPSLRALKSSAHVERFREAVSTPSVHKFIAFSLSSPRLTLKVGTPTEMWFMRRIYAAASVQPLYLLGRTVI